MLLLYEVVNLAKYNKISIDKRLTANFKALVKNYGKQLNINDDTFGTLKAKMFKYYKAMEKANDTNNFAMKLVLTKDHKIILITKDNYENYDITDKLNIPDDALIALKRTFTKYDSKD